MDVQTLYTKLRHSFGRQALFSERGPELCDSLGPDSKIQKEFILRNPIHRIIQNTPSYAKHQVNTTRAEITKTAVNHSEGGWPKDVNWSDIEATQRYRRKIEKEEDYIHCVMHMTPTMEHYVLQNEAIDMYEAYYATMKPQPNAEQSSSRVVSVFNEPQIKGKRPVSSISWTHDGLEFCTSYADMNYFKQPKGILTAYTWSVDDVTGPLSTLEPPDTMLDLQYNERNQHLLAGGLANGQVVCFDTRATARTPTVISAAFTSHRDLVRKVCFINAKSGFEFFSGSSDGSVKWWDLRNMEEPIDSQIIDPVPTASDTPSMVKSMGVSAMEFESTIPTRYMVGTENGYIIGGNRKGKTPTEQLPAKFEAHYGTIKVVERNPQFLKNFLTVGDWTFKIWSEDCRESCIMLIPEQRHRITYAAWSPTRASLISTTMWTGQFALWDLLLNQNKPIVTQQVCEEPLLTLKPHDSGTLVACGSSQGRVFVVELSQFLSQSLKYDKQMMAAIFERENKRERIIEARVREIRLKLRQQEEPSSPKASAITIDMTIGDRDLVEAGSDYMAQVRKELAAM